MADIATLPVMTAADAERIGFARFKDMPMLPLDVPDGDFTIAAKTSDGRGVLKVEIAAIRRDAPTELIRLQNAASLVPVSERPTMEAWIATFNVGLMEAA